MQSFPRTLGIKRKGAKRTGEKIIEKLLFLSALVSVFTMIAIVGYLGFQAVGFFSEVSPFEFLTDTKWTPLFHPQHFGVMPLISGTLLVSAVALATAVPIGFGTAVFLSEYSPDRVRRVVKPALEILAGVPTVVYGYFALTYVTPVLRQFIPSMNVFNSLSAGLVMGIMITPMVSSLSEDAMISVPRLLREGAYALGARRHEVALKVVTPAALSGIMASVVLAMSRAVGETMIVAIAAGSTPRLTANPLEGAQTMTGYIAQISLGEAPFGSLEYNTMFGVGIVLFIITFAMTLLGHWIAGRYTVRY